MIQKVAPWIFGAVAIVILTAVIRFNEARQLPNLPSPPLHELADKHTIEIGTYAALKRLDERQYRYILTTEFEFLTVDGQPNWTFNDGSLRPTKDKFDFTRMDKVFAFAEAHNMPVQAHHFVWGEEKWLPAWLKEGNFTKEELLELIRNHIHTVGERYKGKVHRWSVVNEAFSRGLHAKGLRDWWGDKLGQEYIDKSFIWAREADPNTTLILNDFNNEGFTEVSDAMYEYIKHAKARGVPIDGIGMQMHIDGNSPKDKDEVIKNMQRFGELGIKVYVTELDVNLHDIRDASRLEKLQRQGVIYQEMLEACIESKVCPTFALLGITDRESWYNELGIPNADPLPFDEQYKPKPAYYGLRKALE